MPCRFLVIKSGQIEQKDCPLLQKRQFICHLKLINEEQRRAVCMELVDRGLEGPSTANNCPLGYDANPVECPFYKI